MGNRQKNDIMIEHLVEFFKNHNEELDVMLKDLERVKKDVEIIKNQMDVLRARADTPIELPDWIDTKTALRMLNLKDADTLRRYAKEGFIVQKRGVDRRNYYVKSQILGLTESLMNQ